MATHDSIITEEITMGLFDFVKGIGKKNTAPAEPQAAPASPAEHSAQLASVHYTMSIVELQHPKL